MLMLTPTFVGSLQVTSIKYTLHENGSVVEGIQHLIPVPSSKVSYSSHEADRRLAFTVIKQAPLLHVSITINPFLFYSLEHGPEYFRACTHLIRVNPVYSFCSTPFYMWLWIMFQGFIYWPEVRILHWWNFADYHSFAQWWYAWRNSGCACVLRKFWDLLGLV